MIGPDNSCYEIPRCKSRQAMSRLSKAFRVGIRLFETGYFAVSGQEPGRLTRDFKSNGLFVALCFQSRLPWRISARGANACDQNKKKGD